MLAAKACGRIAAYGRGIATALTRGSLLAALITGQDVR